LRCADGHGEAEGWEMQIGDIEEFFRVAFALLTRKQLGRFWNDPRVSGIVTEIPEYKELAAEIYALDE
jgi:hypothetical protein